MKITCNVRDLKRALSFVGQGIVGKSAILDAVLLVLLSTEEDGLRLSMGSAQLRSTYRIDAQVERPGALYVPWQALSEFALQGGDGAGAETGIEEESCTLSSQSSQPTSLEEDHLALTLAKGDQCTTIEGTLASSIPQHGISAEAESFVLPARLFAEMIAQVVFAASKDEHIPRAFLNVWLHLAGDETLALAACDQSQLALRRVKAPGAVVSYGTLQIPAAAFASLAVLLAAAADEEDECGVWIVPEVEQHQVRFTLPRGEVALQFAETGLLPWENNVPFEPFEKLIPTVLATRRTARIIVPTDKLMVALKSARGLVRCAQKTGENGLEQLFLELYRN